MAADERRQYAPHELAVVLKAVEELGFPCTVIGGQAVNCWAGLFLPRDRALQRFSELTPFVSKDIDFHGDRQAVRDLARKLGSRAELPRLRETFGTLLAGKLCAAAANAAVSVEVLHTIPGFEVRNLQRFTVRERIGNVVVQLLDPIGVLQAKAWNVVHIRKEGRRDKEQFLVMVAVVRAYLRQIVKQCRQGELPLRAFFSTLERVLSFAESPAGRKVAQAIGLNWNLILPQPEIDTAVESEMAALREKRLPRWRRRVGQHRLVVPDSELHRKLLDILAETARPSVTS